MKGLVKYSLLDTPTGGRPAGWSAGRPVAKRDIKANSVQLKLELPVRTELGKS